MVKVALLNPPGPWTREMRCQEKFGVLATIKPPLTLAYLKSLIPDSVIFDGSVSDFTQEDLTGFDFIVINVTTPTISDDVSFIHGLNAKVIAIGAHVTALPVETLKLFSDIDVVIKGEPEEVIIKIINGFALSRINGIAYRKGNQIIENTGFNRVDVNSLPVPDWSSLNLSNYKTPLGRKYLLVELSRGCVNKCKFCVVPLTHGTVLRLRRPDLVVKEIKESIVRYGVKNFYFWGDNATIGIKRVCEAIIKSKLRIRFMCNSRVDTVDYDLLKLMKLAGCWLIAYGIESGNNRTLKLINKNITLNQVKNAVINTKRAGIFSIGLFMLGFDFERDNDVFDTINFACGVNPDFAMFYPVINYPGTEFYKGSFDYKSAEYTNKERILQAKTDIAYKKFYFRFNKFLFLSNFLLTHPMIFKHLMSILKSRL